MGCSLFAGATCSPVSDVRSSLLTTIFRTTRRIDELVKIETMSTLSRLQTTKSDSCFRLIPDLGGVVPRGHKNPLWTHIRDRLLEARQQVGISGSALGAAAGLSNSTVYLVEDLKSVPGIDTIERIAAALGVPACWLAFGYEGSLQWQARRPVPALIEDPPAPINCGQPYRALNAGARERLKLKRDELGLSLRQLSDAAGVSFETIRKIETGKAIPKVDTCERIAVALGVSPCWLAFGVGVSN